MAVSNILTAPTEVKYAESNMKQVSRHDVASGSIFFTSIFGSASNCIINVNMAAPHVSLKAPKNVTEKSVCAQMEMEKQ